MGCPRPFVLSETATDRCGFVERPQLICLCGRLVRHSDSPISNSLFWLTLKTKLYPLFEKKLQKTDRTRMYINLNNNILNV